LGDPGAVDHVVDVVGQFDKGDVVAIQDTTCQEFAHGLTNDSTADARQIRGLRTEQMRQALGMALYDEVVHRDNLVLML
jgi:glutamate 5-kinase